MMKKQNDYEKALVYYFKDLEVSEQINDINSMATIQSHIGGCYIRLGRYKEAKEYYLKSYELNKITQSSGDTFFTLVGLLNCVIVLDPSEISSIVDQLDSHMTKKPEAINLQVLKSFQLHLL